MSTESPTGFPIGELSRRTGVPVSTLRSWERRFGHPASLPRQGDGDHRRYDERAVDVVREVLGRRASGMTLDATMASLRENTPDDPSLFALACSGHADLVVRRLTRRSLLTVTRAIEDEYVARAERSLLFVGFQRGELLRRSERRWQQLARHAELAVAFADLADEGSEDGLVAVTDEGPADQPLRVVDIAGSTLTNEWFLVCDSPTFAVCLSARQQLGPGTDAVADRRPTFEVWWSLDPAVVREASRMCATRAPRHDLEVTRRLEACLEEPVAVASADLRRASALFLRVVTYLARDAEDAHS